MARLAHLWNKTVGVDQHLDESTAPALLDFT
jgi:hypothetical protein